MQKRIVPPEMSDADAAKAKPEMQVFAQKTAGWIDWTRKDFPRAEVELAKAICARSEAGAGFVLVGGCDAGAE